MGRRKSSGDAVLWIAVAIAGSVVWVAQALTRFVQAYGLILIGLVLCLVGVWGIAKMLGGSGKPNKRTSTTGRTPSPIKNAPDDPKPVGSSRVEQPQPRLPIERGLDSGPSEASPMASPQTALGARVEKPVARDAPPVAANPRPSPEPSNSAVFGRKVPVPESGWRTDSHAKPISATWTPPGQAVTVRGCAIVDGMVYIGSDKGMPDASTINPSLNVHFGKIHDYTVSQLGYWPSYREATAGARGAYLQWLADGKQSPEADIGFVFLYFYGLERRVLVDAAKDPTAALDIPAIAAEIIRLLDIYAHNGSFRSYAGSLLGYMQATQSARQPLSDPPPAFAKSWEIPFGLKLGLARFVAQESPIPGEWAYAWWRSSPETRLRTVAERCPEEFRQLFIEYYGQQHKPGLRLRPNKTKLTAVHRVASPSLPSRQYQHALDIPDVTVLTAPMKKLQGIADCCCQALDRYSRHLGRNPDNAGKIDALLELPTLLWPEPMKQPLLKIHGMVSQSGQTLAVKFEKLLSLLPPWETVNKSSYAAFARSINQLGLGVEPDPLFGGGVPERQQTVVLFVGAPQDLMAEPTQRYKTAALSLHFAAAVSLADGEFSLPEREAMVRQLDGWLHLADGERTRLQAHLRWLAAEPPGLNGLKKRIEDMPAQAREALGDFLVLIAQADEQVSPSEVKLLERIFKMLGLEPDALYGKLHAPATSPVTVRPQIEPAGGHAIPRPRPSENEGLGLDMAKVSSLQEDTRRVADLLHSIFGEEESAPTSAAFEETAPGVGEALAENLLGLSHEFSEFVRLLVSRAHWTRSELEELAADRSLLLDGSLEHINEAAFDHFDQALVEGDGPFEINQELVGELFA